LMIRYPGMRQPGQTSHATVETVDLLPTLADLCHLPTPSELDGKSLRPQLEDPIAASIKDAHGFWSGGQRTVRTDRWRLIVQPTKDASTPQVELFDMQSDINETKNVASEHPVTVAELLAKINLLPNPNKKPK
jgi:iduronate 2-sulfatase